MPPPMKLFVEAESLAGRKILATAKSAGLKVEIAGPSKGVTPTGTGIPELLYSVAAKPVRHTNAIMRRLAHTADCGLIGKTFEDESVIDAWMDWANLDIDHVLRVPGATADKLCSVLESHLKNRTFLVNERLTIADIAVAVSLQPGIEAKGIPEVQKTFPATVRWLRTCIEQLQLSPAPKAKAGQQVAKAKPEAASKAAAKSDTQGAAKVETDSSKPSAVAKNEGKASASVVTSLSSPVKLPARKKIPKMRLFVNADSQAAKKILATARLISLDIEIAGASKNAAVCGSPAPELVIDGATPVKHTNAILRHIARLHADCELMGETLAEESQADVWLDWSLLEVDHKLTIVDAPMDEFYNTLERHLKNRTFLVGERLTVADVAVAVSLQPALEKTSIAEAKKAHPALARWWLTCASQLNLATVETVAVASGGSASKEAKGSSSPSKKEAKAEAKVAKAPAAQAANPTSTAPSWGEQLNGAPVKLFVDAGSSVAKRILVTARRVGLRIEIAGAPKSQTPSGLDIPELLSGDSKPVRHVNPILRHIAQLVPDCDLMGLSFTHEALIDAWLEWTIAEVDHTIAYGLPVDAFCRVLDSHLKNRTFLIGESGLTLADIAVAVAVHSALVAKGIDEVKKTYPALTRWLLTCVHQLELN